MSNSVWWLILYMSLTHGYKLMVKV